MPVRPISRRANLARSRWSVVRWPAAVVASLLVVSAFQAAPAQSQAVTSGGYTTSATVSPASVAPGSTASIAAVISSASRSKVLVDVEVYSGSGTKVYQRAYDNQSFAAGARRTYRPAWAVPAGQAAGAYTVEIGIFAPGWGALLHWNNNAAAFTVGSTTTTTTGATTTSTSTTTTSTATSTTSSTSTTSTTAAASLPPLPSGWPRTLQLGMADAPGGASAMRGSAPFGFRYQYLSGGVNTGNGWSTWNTGGQFVSYYVAESQAASITPVFTYYQLLQSAPGNSQGEPAGDFTNLANTTTMTSYYQDLTLFFQRAAGKSPVVLHVEPDLWAYIQQRAQNDDGSTVPAQVASTGLSDLAGLPNTAAGFGQAFVRLRDAYAPNVILAYHFSTWGTGTDILYSRPSDATVSALGVRTGRFYQSLGAGFDISFTDLADRDAAFKQLVYGDGGASWYSADDYRRSALYISAFVQTAKQRVAIWQIPFGNTKMRAENNTWDHYQDNKVEWLLDDTTRAHLQSYAAAGAVAFLFGRGADGTTCACDASGDGVTNPAPINANNGLSLTADDDGGFFHQKAAGYYQTGALSLP